MGTEIRIELEEKIKVECSQNVSLRDVGKLKYKKKRIELLPI